MGILFLSLLPCADARPLRVLCGTHGAQAQEELYLHAQVQAARRSGKVRFAPARLLPDIGQIAILDDTDGVVARRNLFNLQGRLLRFTPLAGDRYRAENTASLPLSGSPGTLIEGIGDDDTRPVALPFSFPFYGRSYQRLFVNSDGSLTFGEGDQGITERSLGQLRGGAPRIAALLRDLDPTVSQRGIFVSADAQRAVFTWLDVPEYSDTGRGPLQTFQITLFADGRIEMNYPSLTTRDAVVGISPGNNLLPLQLVTFASLTSQDITGTITERFTSLNEIDTVTAAQRFYQTHEDSYDYLVFFNTLGVSAASGAVALELTVRNNRTGFGDLTGDRGREYGSASRLQAVLNMGPLSQYPTDPTQPVNAASAQGITGLGVLAHEAGHLSLSYASVRDPLDPDARPMLGRGLVHWAFTFNSDASLMEGSRIQDAGTAASPQYTTTGSSESFSALDQYLMGFRPPAEVPPSFVVTPASISAARAPQVGVRFDGTRRDVTVEELIAAEGRRIPDHTVSQRRYRFAFILVVPQGEQPTEAQLSKLDAYRQQFEAYFATVTGNRASADTSLRRSVRLSLFPAGGVLQGATAQATVELASPVAAPLTFFLRRTRGVVQTLDAVTIPAGARQAAFEMRGLRAGVEELTAEPADASFETTVARIQVGTREQLSLVAVSGTEQTATVGQPLSQPVVVQVVDANRLPYPGVRILFAAGNGTLATTEATTDAYGRASVTWTPTATGTGAIMVRIADTPVGASIPFQVQGRPALTTAGVVNAASYQMGIVPGGIVSIFGVSLTASTRWFDFAQVLLNGSPVQVLSANAGQINVVIPRTLSGATAQLVVQTEAASAPVQVPVLAAQPAVFVVGDSLGAIQAVGTGQLTNIRPVAAGELVEIYGTGLGALQMTASGLEETVTRPVVLVDGRESEVLYSGAAPGSPGLYQINVRVPAGVASGRVPVQVQLGQQTSPVVQMQIR